MQIARIGTAKVIFGEFDPIAQESGKNTISSRNTVIMHITILAQLARPLEKMCENTELRQLVDKLANLRESGR